MRELTRPERYVYCGLVFGLLAVRPVQAQSQQLTIDTDSSEFVFAIEHLGMFTVNGSFQLSSGTVEMDTTLLVPAGARIELNTASVSTDNKSRDEELRSEDFLDPERYPTIRFESRNVNNNKVETGESITISGDLTISGVSKEITVPFVFEIRDEGGLESILIQSHFKISREEFKLSFGRFMDAMVGDEISVRIRIVARADA